MEREEKLEALEKIKEEIANEKRISFVVTSSLIFISVFAAILDFASHEFGSLCMWLIIFLNALTLKSLWDRVFLWKDRATESQIQLLNFMRDIKDIAQNFNIKDPSLTIH